MQKKIRKTILKRIIYNNIGSDENFNKESETDSEYLIKILKKSRSKRGRSHFK